MARRVIYNPEQQGSEQYSQWRDWQLEKNKRGLMGLNVRVNSLFDLLGQRRTKMVLL